MPDLIIGTILCTIGLGFALFSPRGARRNLIPAGLFAFLYGARMLLRNDAAAVLLGNPRALAYLTSALEYIVPIPASIAFVRYLGDRWRPLNQAVVLIFSVVAAIAIPYEIMTRRPHAANDVVNGVVVLLIGVF